MNPVDRQGRSGGTTEPARAQSGGPQSTVAAGALAPIPFSLEGRVALVTGAGRGLGATAADALARAGASVILSDIDDALLEGQSKRFTDKGWPHVVSHLDVADPKQCREVMNRAKEMGRLDILVNNAGIMLRKPAVETTREEFARVLDVDLTSMFDMSCAAFPLMEESGYGRIINLSSIMGHIGRAGQVSYIAAKHGVVGLTKALAAEFGPASVTCNAIGPGYMLTEMNQSILTEGFVESVRRRTPLRRWGNPEDIAGIIVFLASPAASFITGQLILIDGGLTVTVPDPSQC